MSSLMPASNHQYYDESVASMAYDGIRGLLSGTSGIFNSLRVVFVSSDGVLFGHPRSVAAILGRNRGDSLIRRLKRTLKV
eukprot:COSAG04_NODE_4140_length_2274_cov_2.235862_3_plen_79_part_01